MSPVRPLCPRFQTFERGFFPADLVRSTPESGPPERRPRTAAVVKGCRTPAGYRRVRRARSAGVGQASGEETAGRDGRGGATSYGDLTAWPLALMAASSERFR